MLSCCDGFGIVFPHHCIARNFARNLCLKGSIAADADLRGVIDWPNIIPCIEENEKNICGWIFGLRNAQSKTFALNPERDNFFCLRSAKISLFLF